MVWNSKSLLHGSLRPFSIPFGESREVEILVRSLMCKNNLMNSFLFRVDRAVASLLSICGLDEQTVLHLLSSCELLDTNLKCQAKRIITLCNSSKSMVDLAAEQGPIILNCSRDFMFISVCIEIVESLALNLKQKINLSKKWGFTHFYSYKMRCIIAFGFCYYYDEGWTTKFIKVQQSDIGLLIWQQTPLI